MAEPLTPQDIARRTFDVARRGYEQQEVRGFLHEVSALVERLGRTETELRERAERAEAKVAMADHPDEATLLEALGEETTRVLTSAREAAGEIRGKAEAAAARLIEEATAEAADIRARATQETDALLADAREKADELLEQARTELERRSAEAEEVAARIRADGQTAADALREEGRAAKAQAEEEGAADREAARQEGRRMVAEAQAVRERVLRDLAVRRKRSRQQVEKLNAGRERLLEAYDVVRRTVDEATSELSTALLDARLAADAAARRIDEEPDPTIEQLDEEVANAGLVDLPIADLPDELTDEPPVDAPADAGEAAEDEEDSPGPFSGEVPAVPAAAPTPSTEVGGGPVPDGPRVIEVDHGRGRKRRKKGFEGLPPAELTVLEPPSGDEGVRILAEPAEEPAAEEPAAEGPGEPEPAEAPGAPGEPAAEEPVSEGVVVEEPATEEPAVEEPVAADPGAEEPTTEAPGDEAPGDEAQGFEEPAEPAARDASELFARLRAGQDEPDASADDAGAGPSLEEAPGEGQEVQAEEPSVAEGDLGQAVDDAARPFAARQAALEPVEKDLSRRLKRALADEQNEVLDLLRRAKPKGVDDLLPDPDAHAARWADAAMPPLLEAAGAGADWSGGTPSTVADLADELARSLTAPLRERIDRSFSASDGNLDEVADRVRALYREWKGQRLVEATAHFAGAAYARGVFDGISAGAEVHWTLDPSAGACPDCDDNVLAGVLAKGDEFPTGNVNAPAHPGCHCLVLGAER